MKASTVYRLFDKTLKIILPILPLFLFSCFQVNNSMDENKDIKLIIKKETVQKIMLQCGEGIFQLNSKETSSLIDKINSAKQVGLVKAKTDNLFE